MGEVRDLWRECDLFGSLKFYSKFLFIFLIFFHLSLVTFLFFFGLFLLNFLVFFYLIVPKEGQSYVDSFWVMRA
jgi:hypothetical protein